MVVKHRGKYYKEVYIYRLNVGTDPGSLRKQYSNTPAPLGFNKYVHKALSLHRRIKRIDHSPRSSHPRFCLKILLKYYRTL